MRRWEKTLAPLARFVDLGRVAHRHDGDEEQVVRKVERAPQGREVRDAEDRGREALVDRREHERHHGGARIDVPVRSGPLELRATRDLQLVGLLVALVVVGLAREDDDVHRRVGLPARAALRGELLLGGGDRDLLARRRVGDDDQPQALAEPRGSAHERLRRLVIRSSMSRGTGRPS